MINSQPTTSRPSSAPLPPRPLKRVAAAPDPALAPDASAYSADRLLVSSPAVAIDRPLDDSNRAPSPARSASPVGVFDAVARTLGGFFSRLVGLLAAFFSGARERAIAPSLAAHGPRLDRPAPVDAGQIVSHNGASLVVDGVGDGIIAPNSSR